MGDNGTLAVRFDGDAALVITAIPSSDVVLSDDADGDLAASDLASQIQTALRDGAANHQFLGPNGQPITNAARVAELGQITCRWDRITRRFALSSGRTGVAETLRRSSVEITSPSSLSADLGLDGAVPAEGHRHRHRLPVARAMTVDFRLEIWAASQTDIASLIDDLNRRAPSRGSLLTLPALLAHDIPAGATSLRLLSKGEPVSRASMVQFEAADSISDRVSGRSFDLTQSTPDVTASRVRLGGTDTLAIDVSPTPLVPGPFDTNNPAPRGLALAIGVALESGGSVGQSIRLCSLDRGGQPVLRLDVSLLAPPPPSSVLTAEITAVSTFQGGQAETQWRVPLDRLEGGVTLHATVIASTGVVELFIDGNDMPVGTTAVTVTPATGAFGAGNDMVLTAGQGGSGGNPLFIDVSHLHLFSEPVGGYDIKLRDSIAPARRFAPGRRIQIAETSDGVSPGDRRAETTVVSVNGDELQVSPAIEGAWIRRRTIVYAEEYFFHQAHLRRRDDLLNHLYRITAEYKISAMLEDDTPEAPAPIAEIAEVDVDALGPTRPMPGAPRVTINV